MEKMSLGTSLGTSLATDKISFRIPIRQRADEESRLENEGEIPRGVHPEPAEIRRPSADGLRMTEAKGSE
jgi:hypothetical protein